MGPLVPLLALVLSASAGDPPSIRPSASLGSGLYRSSDDIAKVAASLGRLALTANVEHAVYTTAEKSLSGWASMSARGEESEIPAELVRKMNGALKESLRGKEAQLGFAFFSHSHPPAPFARGNSDYSPLELKTPASVLTGPSRRADCSVLVADLEQRKDVEVASLVVDPAGIWVCASDPQFNNTGIGPKDKALTEARRALFKATQGEGDVQAAIAGYKAAAVNLGMKVELLPAGSSVEAIAAAALAVRVH